MDFTSQIQNISEDQLNMLFDGVAPLKTDIQPPAEETKTDAKAEPQLPPAVVGLDSIPQIDLDELEKEGDKSDDTNSKDDKKVDDKKDTKTDDGKDDAKTDSTLEAEQINLILKNTTDYLISKGIWEDFEGRENFEITEESYAELAVKQYESKLQDMFDELVDSTGDYGKAIIHHIKNGGNPDEVIDLFKEQKQLESIDITDKRSQLNVIEKYYSDVVGWSKSKIDKYVSTLQASDNGLEDEAKEVMDKFDEIHKGELDRIKKQQAAERVEKEKRNQEYINKLSSAVDSFEELTDIEKRTIKNSVLKFDKKLPDGTPINDFYLKFYEIQNDPKKYVELIHFVIDNENYKKKQQVKQDGEAVKKSWNFVKGNASINKKSTETVDTSAKAKKLTELNFSGLLKKK